MSALCNASTTPAISTLSLHDALPIFRIARSGNRAVVVCVCTRYCLTRRTKSECTSRFRRAAFIVRSEEHTSELQSLRHLVCRLLLEKKKKTQKKHEWTNQSQQDVMSE